MTNTAARNQVFAALESQRHAATQAPREQRYADYIKERDALSAAYKAALLAGDGAAAEQYRSAGVALIEQYHGTEV